MNATPLELGEGPLTVDAVERLREGVPAILAETARLRIQAARKVVLSYSQPGAQAVYGLNTGVGSLKRVRVATGRMTDFNRTTIRDHAGGVGPYLANDLSRALLAARVHALGAGRAGASLDVVTSLLHAYNAGLAPEIHAWGSVGMSDLTPLAEMARLLLGEGHAIFRGRRMSARRALRLSGVERPGMGAKDALALINANTYGFLLAAAGLFEATRLASLSVRTLALTMEALLANPSVIDPLVALANLRPDQARVADRLRALLHDGPLAVSGTGRELQDPISVRSAPQVHGALETVLAEAKETVGRALGAGAENPLVDSASSTIVSCGNFDSTDVVLSLDRVRSAIFHALHLSARRTGLLLTRDRSGLPTNLAERDGDYGFGVLHHMTASLEARARFLSQATPVQADALAEGIEDYGANTPLGAGLLGDLLEVWRLIIGAEILVATTALRMRATRPGGAQEELVQTVIRATNTHLRMSRGEAVEAVTQAAVGPWRPWYRTARQVRS